MLAVESGKKQEILLPESLRNLDRLTVWMSPAREIFVTEGYAYATTARQLILYRLNPAGEILQTIPISIDGYAPLSDRAWAWRIAPVGPVPVAWAGSTAIAGAASFARGEYPSFQEGVRHWLSVIGPPMIVVLLISLLAAFWVYRSERHYYGAHPLAWSITTLLLGPSMLVAYLIERGRPVTTTCGACHAQVPAKRNACAKCGAEFPAAERTGCEIFAA
jgi:hypothetical protein